MDVDAIRAAPDDDGPRLVWADELSAAGDPRGELIVVQCRLASAGLPREERVRLATRNVELLREHGAKWLGNLPSLCKSWRWRRGFVESVELTLDQAEKGMATIAAIAPLVMGMRLLGVEVTGHGDNASRWLAVTKRFTHLLETMPFALRELDVPAAGEEGGGDQYSGPSGRTPKGDEVAALVAASPRMRALREISIAEIGESGAKTIIDSFPGLERLMTSRCRFEPLVERLEKLPRLRCLTIAGADDCKRWLPRFLASKAASQLVELELISCGIGDEELSLLADAPALARVESLGLRGNGHFRAKGIAALVRSPHLRPTSLDLAHNSSLDDEAIRELTRWKQLRRLRLQSTRIDGEVGGVLKRLPALELADVRGTKVPPEIREELAHVQEVLVDQVPQVRKSELPAALLDAAFAEIAGLPGSTPGNRLEEFRATHPQETASQCREALELAYALKWRACGLADDIEHHRHWVSQEDAVRWTLPQDCPGFSEATYRRALADGWTINRW